MKKVEGGPGRTEDLGRGLMKTSGQTRLAGVKGLVWKVWGSKKRR